MGAPKPTVTVASTASPGTAPVEESIPEGTSIESTGHGALFNWAMADA